jgi:hypothetical protein
VSRFLSDAAYKRITARVAAAIVEDDGMPRAPITTLLDAAIESENFARPRGVAVRIVERWIRDGIHPHLAADFFHNVVFERDELREAGRDLMNGIRAFGRLRV